MIINVHSHLIDRNMWSEYFWETTINLYSKTMNVPKEILIQTLLPKIAEADVKKYIEAMDDAGIDIGVVNGVDYGLSAAGEAKWSVEEMNQWIAQQVNEYPNKLYALNSILHLVFIPIILRFFHSMRNALS